MRRMGPCRMLPDSSEFIGSIVQPIDHCARAVVDTFSHLPIARLLLRAGMLVQISSRGGQV